MLACPHGADAGTPSIRAPTPYDDQHTIEMGVDAEARIRPCQGGANPNCVSSASRNAMCVLRCVLFQPGDTRRCHLLAV